MGKSRRRNANRRGQQQKPQYQNTVTVPAKVILAATPQSAGYKAIPHMWFQQPRDLPPFSFATVRAMLLDPGVRSNFAKRAAPITGAQFCYKENKQWVEGMRCSRPEIGVFIYKQLQRIWNTFLPAILRSQVWGWSAGEITLRLSPDGLIEINKLEPRHASDCRILKLGHKRWGVAISRVESKGQVNLQFPYAWFHAYNAEDGDDYGVSAAIGGYSPWADKWFNGGALDVRRTFMHKDAYGGADMTYPEGDTIIEGIAVPNNTIARQIVEQLEAGGVTTRPSTRDGDGNEKWTLTRATIPGNPAHILQYPKDLDGEIKMGMEVGDEDDASSDAWAAKRVTMAAMYASLDHWIVQIIADLREQVFDPLCMLNWGEVPEYEILHKPLAEQAMEQQSNAGPGAGAQQPGTPGQPGAAGDDGQAGGMPGAPQLPQPQQPPQDASMPLVNGGAQRMSLDSYVGGGEIDVSSLAAAMRRVVNRAMERAA